MQPLDSSDIIGGIKSALQHIACHHPPDFIRAMHRAYLKEQSPAAKDAIAQILINSRMCAENLRPICQDTGVVAVLAEVGMNTRFAGDLTLQEMVDEGVRIAYSDKSNPLRASMVSSPLGERKNTGDNTPAILHVKLVRGSGLDLFIFAKGGGSENKTRFAVLNPNEDIENWVVKTVEGLGAGWCPPGIIGIGLGGTPDKTIELAKESLLAPIDIADIQNPANELEELRLRLYEKINALGIGAQGLGGNTTVLDVKIKTMPTHASSLPIGLMPNCAANRHIHISFDNNGEVKIPQPDLSLWPVIKRQISFTRKLDVNELNPANLKAGQTVLLSGKILTARDAAHKKIHSLLQAGISPEDLGADFTNRVLFYVGPVAPVGGEAVGPAGPTTAARMDGYTEMVLKELGVKGMIGKAERGDQTIALIKKYGAVYFSAVGGAAYLVAKAVKSAKVVAFPELGMEAVYEFEVKDMPVTVAVDGSGNSIHRLGPEQWRK